MMNTKTLLCGQIFWMLLAAVSPVAAMESDSLEESIWQQEDSTVVESQKPEEETAQTTLVSPILETQPVKEETDENVSSCLAENSQGVWKLENGS